MDTIGRKGDRSGEGWTCEKLGDLIGASRLPTNSFDALTPIDRKLRWSRLSHVYLAMLSLEFL